MVKEIKDNAVSEKKFFDTTVKRIDKVAKNFEANYTEAREIAMESARYTVETGNSDLLRHLRSALPDPIKTKLDRWVSSVIPYKYNKDKDSYPKSKKMEAEYGLIIRDEAVFATHFDTFKPAKEEKPDYNTAARFKLDVKEYLKTLNPVVNRAKALSEPLIDAKTNEELRDGYPIFKEVYLEANRFAAMLQRMLGELESGGNVKDIAPKADIRNDLKTDEQRAAS